jgi:hypothetical protein
MSELRTAVRWEWDSLFFRAIREAQCSDFPYSHSAMAPTLIDVWGHRLRWCDSSLVSVISDVRIVLGMFNDRWAQARENYCDSSQQV